MLHLAFVCARAIDTVGDRIEMVRVRQRQRRRAAALHDPNPVGDGQLSISRVWLGLQGDTGVLVAGSERLDFRTAIDTLLLRMAANQATIAIYEADAAVRQRMVGGLSERTRIARELHDTLLQRRVAMSLRRTRRHERRESGARRALPERRGKTHGRMAEISEIVDAILYLDLASLLRDGETLSVDGGQSGAGETPPCS
jgi:signal transduction histidine kinase